MSLVSSLSPEALFDLTQYVNSPDLDPFNGISTDSGDEVSTGTDDANNSNGISSPTLDPSLAFTTQELAPLYSYPRTSSNYLAEAHALIARIRGRPVSISESSVVSSVFHTNMPWLAP